MVLIGSFYFLLRRRRLFFHLFFFNDTPPTEIYTLSLHDALPIYLNLPSETKLLGSLVFLASVVSVQAGAETTRSEEHTSELQSRFDLVCRLLLEKKKKK